MFRSSVVVCMLKGMIAKSSSGNKNVYLEEDMVDFFRYLRTLSPKACDFVSANTGLDTKGISDRWLRKLNTKDRGESVHLSDTTTMCNVIKKMIQDRDKSDGRLTFYVAIDATKVPKSLNINAARKYIMGGAFPQHMIATQHLRQTSRSFNQNRPNLKN